MNTKKISRKGIFTLILFIIASSIISNAFAQQRNEKNSTYSVDKLSHNFGNIKERGGKAVAVFTIINNSKTPLVIDEVKTSCGCTTSSFTKSPIAKGKRGNISIAYDPAGRMYPFNKAITVITNGIPAVMVLHITGNVIK